MKDDMTIRRAAIRGGITSWHSRISASCEIACPQAGNSFPGIFAPSCSLRSCAAAMLCRMPGNQLLGPMALLATDLRIRCIGVNIAFGVDHNVKRLGQEHVRGWPLCHRTRFFRTAEVGGRRSLCNRMIVGRIFSYVLRACLLPDTGELGRRDEMVVGVIVGRI
jgi:hypothetical protein